MTHENLRRLPLSKQGGPQPSRSRLKTRVLAAHTAAPVPAARRGEAKQSKATPIRTDRDDYPTVRCHYRRESVNEHTRSVCILSQETNQQQGNRSRNGRTYGMLSRASSTSTLTLTVCVLPPCADVSKTLEVTPRTRTACTARPVSW